MKIPGFFHRLNTGILYPGIFQESTSRDFLVPGFFDPGISRDIPGAGYPVDIPKLNSIFDSLDEERRFMYDCHPQPSHQLPFDHAVQAHQLGSLLPKFSGLYTKTD